MPLFTNKFSPKKIPVRKQDSTVLKKEFGSDYASKELAIELGQLKLKLGDFEATFDEDGQWIPVSGQAGQAHKENIRLKRSLRQLEEENNMLRLKFEIILDMLAEQSAGSDHLNELQRSQDQSNGSLQRHRSIYKGKY